MVEKIDIEYLANLSALKLSKEQKVKFEKEFDEILNFVNIISNTNIDDQINYNIIDVDQLREDVVKEGLSQDEVLTNAPNKKQGCFAVPLMME